MDKGAERIFGWTETEMLGQPITKIIPPERQQEEPQILERLRRGERVDHFETIRITKDGRLIDVSVTISPLRDHHGTIIGASKIARDITLHKRFQQELAAAKQAADLAKQAAEAARVIAEQAKEEAEVANRAKDHFLSVLSHELRTPLTPVLGALSLIEQEIKLEPQLREQLSMIRRNVETEAHLVDDLLDLTRIAHGKIELEFEVVDAHALIRNVLAMFERETENKSLTVALSLHAKQPHIWADPGRFQQIFLNLVSNAVKFTPQGGTITVATANENGKVKIAVHDTGVGIEPQVLPHLFQPFEQGQMGVSRQYGGLGLGLSIVKSLVEMHKGTVSATSIGKDRGVTFTVELNSVVPGLGVRQLPTLAVSVAPERNYRVLLVEDHCDTRIVMREMLKILGCEVVAASSVGEALAAVEEQCFDLLVSDISLGDGTGMDLIRHIRKRLPSLKGIAISGYGQQEDLRRSREAGFAIHLIKPVNFLTLHEVIQKLMRSST
jgi:PAS domain S-box-containing protein